MPDQLSPNLSLPNLGPGHSQKHVTLNETIRLVDVLVQARVASAAHDLPASPLGAGAISLVRQLRVSLPGRKLHWHRSMTGPGRFTRLNPGGVSGTLRDVPCSCFTAKLGGLLGASI